TVLRGSALREQTEAGLRRARRLDTIWGIAAALWIITGLWRLFGGVEKPLAYYLANHRFMAKMVLFVLIVALGISPMITLTRARSALCRRLDRRVFVWSSAKRIQLIGQVQAPLALAMVFLAPAM